MWTGDPVSNAPPHVDPPEGGLVLVGYLALMCLGVGLCGAGCALGWLLKAAVGG